MRFKLLCIVVVLSASLVNADEPPPIDFDGPPPIVFVSTVKPKVSTYAEAFASATIAKKPLIVFVNQPWCEVKGCVICRQDNPALPPQVWVGVTGPDGVMYRATVAGTPLESDILARTHSLDKELNHPAPVQQAGWSNVGICNCQTVTGRCQCVPASKCSRGGCPSVEQLQQQARPYQPTYTLPTTQAPSYQFSQPCST